MSKLLECTIKDISPSHITGMDSHGTPTGALVLNARIEGEPVYRKMAVVFFKEDAPEDLIKKLKAFANSIEILTDPDIIGILEKAGQK